MRTTSTICCSWSRIEGLWVWQVENNLKRYSLWALLRNWQLYWIRITCSSNNLSGHSSPKIRRESSSANFPVAYPSASTYPIWSNLNRLSQSWSIRIRWQTCIDALSCKSMGLEIGAIVTEREVMIFSFYDFSIIYKIINLNQRINLINWWFWIGWSRWTFKAYRNVRR